MEAKVRDLQGGAEPQRDCLQGFPDAGPYYRACRWFVMKQGRIFWFKEEMVTPDSVPRGVIDVSWPTAGGTLIEAGLPTAINLPCLKT